MPVNCELATQILIGLGKYDFGRMAGNSHSSHITKGIITERKKTVIVGNENYVAVITTVVQRMFQ